MNTTNINNIKISQGYIKAKKIVDNFIQNNNFILYIRLHSSNSTVSSNDKIVCKLFTNSNKNEVLNFINEKLLTDNTLQISMDSIEIDLDENIIYLADNTYSNLPFGTNASNKEMYLLIASYLEYSFIPLNLNSYEKTINELKFTFNLHDNKNSDIINEYLNNLELYQEYKTLLFRKNNQFVFLSYEEKQNICSIDDFQGGFSNDFWKKLLEIDSFKKYLNELVVYGYIGSFERRFIFDKELEKIALIELETNSDFLDIFTMFLTSSYGRHFADSLDGCNTLCNKPDFDIVKNY